MIFLGYGKVHNTTTLCFITLHLFFYTHSFNRNISINITEEIHEFHSHSNFIHTKDE